MKCPHCGKPLALVAAESSEATPSYLPAKDLEETLGEYLEHIDVIDTEGKLIVQPLDGKWMHSDTWKAIMKIVQAHGGTWITGGSDERHWEVPK